MPVGAARSADNITVSFSKPLQTLSGAQALGFELCADGPGTCRYADARVQDSTVVIKGDGRPVTRVRHAWADYPVVNLYDVDMLPVPVFEVPIG